jgi:hypothetical protein
MMISLFGLFSPRRTFLFAAVWCLAACGSGGTSAQAALRGNAPTAPARSHSLAIVAYNYTDRYMDSFEVNGQGGGNLDISKEFSGGGKTACCVRWTDGSALPKKVTVKWVASYCIRHDKTSDGEEFRRRESLWKIADLQFNGPVPANPQNFEVHFYRDGHIELAMSESDSLPRLQLPSPPNGYVRPGVVVNDPPCPEGYDSLAAYNNPERVDATAKGQQ